MATVTRKAKSVKFTCSIITLTIEINDHRYSVDEIPAGEFGSKAFRLSKHSARDGGAVYDVVRDVHGCVACDCPSYETTHRGTSSMCKHGRALVELGLVSAPIAVGAPAPVACCPASEPIPCAACVEVPTVEAAPCVACVEAPTSTPIELFPGEMVDPGDMESDPQLWAPEWDADVWAVTPDDGPTDEDLEDYREWSAEVDARGFLDASERLSLVELIERHQGFFEGWGNAAGRMFASAMAELALKARMVDATTPDELQARVATLDADIRDQWRAEGYDAAMSECGERAACLGSFGHPA